MVKPWLSLHCFLADPVRQDAFLSDVVMPQVRAWHAADKIATWFFIRYWEGGPHLRLRLCGPATGDAAPFLGALGASIGRYTSHDPPSREAYYSGHSFDGDAVDPSKLPWFAEGSIAVIPYVPETLRYGGPAALPLNEKLFEKSSALTAGIVAQIADPLARTVPAFALMATTARIVAGRDGVADYAARYAAGWATYSPANSALAARLSAETSDPRRVAALRGLLSGDRGRAVAGWGVVVDELCTALRNLADAGLLDSPFGPSHPASTDDVIAAIVGSQLHMLNNRLGLTPAAELILASRLARDAAAITAPLEMVA